ncbi:2-hydroxyacid dehydrogenase [Xylophilus sp. GOD-11R]|uniref:2-hydroxyacid dehydrogenase n=1 Tax=Xylophilus sp. GOD-11R TaxID=3089814 RepID=UPI00298C5BBA|nr:2-hydroxyacid dehydrogenase [Xylophilus sp. GOD-11R]WPB58142.1 2-hydroxyacid dehydrogenase [Xylophilus sp. GOD-11R]
MTSSSHRILQIARLPLPALNTDLSSAYDVVNLAEQGDKAAFLAEHGASFDAVVTSAALGLKADVIAALPNLKVVSSFGVGYDALDLPALQARGIPVGYTPGVLNECVADLAFALLMDVSRAVSACDRFVRRGDWSRGGFPLQTKVSGKRVGIVGMGRIGQAVAQRAAGFDMEVAYHNRRPAEGSSLRYVDSLVELARWCDFLVLTVSGGADTRHLIDAGVLEALGPKGFLINVARGTVVDEAALVSALADKRIAGAGLDVFDKEPAVPEALFALDNVVLTAHVASATWETRRAMGDLVLDNLSMFFEGGQVKVAVPGTQPAATA